MSQTKAQFIDGLISSEFDNINATGIITASSAVFSGNVSIGGTLTYEDVTNIDSVGLITARSGIHLGPTSNDIRLGTGATITSPSSDTIALLTNSSERVRITSSGNFGIGTTSPSQRLNLNIGGDQTWLQIDKSRASDEAMLQLVHTATNRGSRIRYANADSSWTVGIDGSESFVFTSGEDSISAGGTERARIDSSGRLLIGTSSSAGTARLVQIAATSSEAGLSATRYVNDAGGAGAIDLAKSRNGTIGSQTIVQSGDTLGYFQFRGSDGTNQLVASNIKCEVDGTPGTNDMPGRLIFSTTADGASTPTERLRIDSSGRLLQGKTSTKGSTGENIPTYCTEIASNNPNILEIANNGTASGSYSALVLSRSDATSVNGHTAVDSGDKIGEVAFIGADGSDRFNTGAAIAAIAQSDFSSNNCPTHLTFSTNGGSAIATERMRIDSSGRLLVGTSSSSVANAAIFQSNSAGSDVGVVTIASKAASPANGALIGVLDFADSNHARTARIQVDRDGGTWTSGVSQPSRLVFSTTADGASSPTERMRITSNGTVLIQMTAANSAISGCYFNASTAANFHQVLCHTSSTASLANLYLNRQSTDGTLIAFRQADVTEGSVSVSGTTVTYNGGHIGRWSQLLNSENPSNLLKGTVMSNLDEMCEWEGEDNEQLNKTKVSDLEGDPNVAGVFVSTSFSEDGPLDFIIGMTGDMVIRIAQGTTVARGDLLMSAGDGTAKPQDDDIIRSKTIAKVTSTNVSETYADGSYCVPCVLMAC